MKLTRTQFAIWIGQKMNPKTPLYNMVHAFTIYGKIDVTIFQKSFYLLVEKSDALRTIFIENNEEPEMQVITDGVVNYEFLDFSNKTLAEIKSWQQEKSIVSFDLERCLYYCALIKKCDDEYVLYLNIHHLITDATSSTIVFKTLDTIYKSLLSQSDTAEIEIPHFKDYVVFENEKSLENKSIINYWEEKVTQVKTLPKLYGKSNSNLSTSSDRIYIHLGKERTNKIKALAQLPEVRSWTQDLTLFNIFTSALFVFLYRIGDLNQIAIGAPVHNRINRQFKKTPGIFIEFFPLIVELSEVDTFIDVINKVKLETNAYLKYAKTGSSSVEINKVYNVTLNYINAKFSNFNNFEISSEWIHPDHSDSNHALRCNVYDMDNSGNVSLLFDLNNSIFNDQLKSRIADHFLNVLDQITEHLTDKVTARSIISKQEIQK